MPATSCDRRWRAWLRHRSVMRVTSGGQGERLGCDRLPRLAAVRICRRMKRVQRDPRTRWCLRMDPRASDTSSMGFEAPPEWSCPRNTILSLHGLGCYDPLLAELADIPTVDEPAVCHGLSEGALVESPDRCRIAEGDESVKGGLYGLAVMEELVTGDVDVIVSDNAVPTDVYRDGVIELWLLFQGGRTWGMHQ